NHVIRRIALSSGEVATIVGAGWDERAPAPRALAFDARGRLFIAADEALYGVPPGGAPRLLAGDPQQMGHRDGVGARARFKGPIAMVAGPGGAIDVAEVNGQVRRVDPDSGEVTTIADLARILESIAVDDRGDLYVGGAFEIDRISAAGARTVVVSVDQADALVQSPIGDVAGLAVDSAARALYVLDELRLQDASLHGTVITLRRLDLTARTEGDPVNWWVPPGHHPTPPFPRRLP